MLKPRVRYAAASPITAGKLQISSAMEPVLKLLADNADADPALRHAGIMALRGMPDSTREVQLSQHHPSQYGLRSRRLAQRQDPQVSAFLKDKEVIVQTKRASHQRLPQLLSLGCIGCVKPNRKIFLMRCCIAR